MLTNGAQSVSRSAFWCAHGPAAANRVSHVFVFTRDNIAATATRPGLPIFFVNQLDFHVQKLEEACGLGNWVSVWYHTQQIAHVQEQLYSRTKLARY